MIRRVVLAALVVLGALAVTGPAYAVDPPFDDAVAADGGASHSCALTSAHKMSCWGSDGDGQLGNGPNGDSGTGRSVLNVPGTGPLSAVRQFSAGGAATCAVLNNNEARCWGDNSTGQIGIGGGGDQQLPAVVSNAAGSGPLTGIRSITVGFSHTCALLAIGQVRCWGANGAGQLGDGTTTTRFRPVVVRSTNGTGALTGVVQLSAGSFHTCATLGSGQVRCWGANEHGRVGDGTQVDRKHPVVVRDVDGRGPLTGVRQVIGAGSHTCARLASGQARCWGTNTNGELGAQLAAVQRLLPVVVRQRTGSHPALTGVTGLGTASNTTCAILTNRQVRCWGTDFSSELGNGVLNGGTGPVAVLSANGPEDPPASGNLSGITQLQGGTAHLCARHTDGRVLCWGLNDTDQLGTGSGDATINRPRSALRSS